MVTQTLSDVSHSTPQHATVTQQQQQATIATSQQLLHNQLLKNKLLSSGGAGSNGGESPAKNNNNSSNAKAKDPIMSLGTTAIGISRRLNNLIAKTSNINNNVRVIPIHSDSGGNIDTISNTYHSNSFNNNSVNVDDNSIYSSNHSSINPRGMQYAPCHFVHSRLTTYYGSLLDLQWSRAVHSCDTCQSQQSSSHNPDCHAVHYGMCTAYKGGVFVNKRRSPSPARQVPSLPISPTKPASPTRQIPVSSPTRQMPTSPVHLVPVQLHHSPARQGPISSPVHQVPVQQHQSPARQGPSSSPVRQIPIELVPPPPQSQAPVQSRPSSAQGQPVRVVTTSNVKVSLRDIFRV